MSTNNFCVTSYGDCPSKVNTVLELISLSNKVDCCVISTSYYVSNCKQYEDKQRMMYWEINKEIVTVMVTTIMLRITLLNTVSLIDQNTLYSLRIWICHQLKTSERIVNKDGIYRTHFFSCNDLTTTPAWPVKSKITSSTYTATVFPTFSPYWNYTLAVVSLVSVSHGCSLLAQLQASLFWLRWSLSYATGNAAFVGSQTLRVRWKIAPFF